MRKRRQEEEDNLERWVISYADLLTLLFAFFVVIYAISTVNMNKYRKLASSLHVVFNSSKSRQIYLSDSAKTYSSPFESKGEADKPRFNMSQLQDIFNNEMMKITKFNKDWVEIEMNSNLIFKSGDAEPKVKAAVRLQKVAKYLKGTPFRIVVEGYTDNIPISTVVYPSNWELSASRAAAVVRLLTSYGVDPRKITPVGFADMYPIASNETAEGREKNRRVVIVIARDVTVPRILDPSISLKQRDLKDKELRALDAKTGRKAKGKVSDSKKSKSYNSIFKRSISKPVQLPSGVETYRKPNGALIIRKKKNMGH